MLFMGWVEETCAGQHHWPQAHRMANKLAFFPGTCHWNSVTWEMSEKIGLCIWKSLFLTHKSTVYRPEVWLCFVTSGVPQHLIFFFSWGLRCLLLLLLRKPGVSVLHGNICFRVFCLPCFSNLVQQIFYVTGTLLRSCGCPAAVRGFVLHKPATPRAAASVPVTGGEGLPMAVYQSNHLSQVHSGSPSGRGQS